MHPIPSLLLIASIPIAFALWALALVVRNRLREQAEHRGIEEAHARLAALLKAYCRAWGARHGLVLISFGPTQESAFAVALARMDVSLSHINSVLQSMSKPPAPGTTVPIPALDVWIGYQGRRPRVLVAQPDSLVGRVPEEGFFAHEQAISALTEATLPRFWGRDCPMPAHAHLATWEHHIASLHTQMEALYELQRLLPEGVTLQDLPMDTPLSDG